MLDNNASSREFDFLVYGATGYTGKKVAAYAISAFPSLSIGISGRNEPKLRAAAEELGLPSSAAVVASLDDDGSGTNAALIEAVGRARVILACAGPYRQCGMPLVKAAIKARTDYLDLCGEPQFFDDALAECEEEARAGGVLIVSACAFDCVPAELSAALVAREVRRRYAADGGEDGGSGGVVSGIEVCHIFGGVAKANATTFHAAVDGFNAASNGELKKSRDAVKKKFNIARSPKRPDDWPKLPPTPGNLPAFHEPSEAYALKFPGADAAAILASWRYQRIRDPERYSHIPQPRLSVCFGCPDKFVAAKVLGVGAVFSGLARYKWGCGLLHGHPEFFSNGVFTEGGPTEQELKEGYFCTHSAGYGKTDKQIVRATCKGPEPGYVATPRMLVALGLTVLNHRDKLAFAGGVTLPGALFGECDEAYDVLKKCGVAFEVQQAE
uniref:Saccharopine dehydrogenase NADP binding domain-containing protein n=1 Tax=Odontella aurita TaxID=265563 RepID=A0A7S4J3K3_9STRA|mmetsp:Transcript_37317/g.111782  ORF Transcript_37317/g.111782 Transcript_37317/m.111782 type:complete len:441 (+) Transcript_37317:181-1503(+)